MIPNDILPTTRFKFEWLLWISIMLGVMKLTGMISVAWGVVFAPVLLPIAVVFGSVMLLFGILLAILVPVTILLIVAAIIGSVAILIAELTERF